MTLREQILALDDRRTQPVAVPEWDCTLYVSTMTAAEQFAYASLVAQCPDEQHNAALLVFAVKDESGNAVFTPEDVPALAQKNSAPVLRLVGQALQLHVGVTKLKND